MVIQVRWKLTVKKFILIQTGLQNRLSKTTGREESNRLKPEVVKTKPNKRAENMGTKIDHRHNKTEKIGTSRCW